MDWLDLLYAAGNVVVVVAFARAAEKFIDYPGSIARFPPLRWAANVVVSIALIAAIIFGLQPAAVAGEDD